MEDKIKELEKLLEQMKAENISKYLKERQQLGAEYTRINGMIVSALAILKEPSNQAIATGDQIECVECPYASCGKGCFYPGDCSNRR